MNRFQATVDTPELRSWNSEPALPLPSAAASAVLQVGGLTPKDIADLDFIAQHAAMVGFSFVNEPEDVQHLQRELHARGADHVGIVLKVSGAQHAGGRPRPRETTEIERGSGSDRMTGAATASVLDVTLNLSYKRLVIVGSIRGLNMI